MRRRERHGPTRPKTLQFLPTHRSDAGENRAEECEERTEQTSSTPRGFVRFAVLGSASLHRTVFRTTLGLAGLASGTIHAATSAYEEIVAPFFQARCVVCHGEQKQKAKLALHDWEAVRRGSDAGPIFIAGKPGESTLVERLQLPKEDEEHMPPTEKPQPAAEEIELIARWIERGASPTMTVAELQLPEALREAAAQLPARLAALPRVEARTEPRWEFDPDAVKRLRAPLAEVVAKLQARFPGALNYESRTSASLQFTAAAFGRDFGDAELAALQPVREQLVTLDIASTGVTDASASVLAGFSQLRVLRAGFTELGDAAVNSMTTLANLESLSMPDTRTTATSVDALKRMARLRSLRLGRTAAEAPALAAGLPVLPSSIENVTPRGP